MVALFPINVWLSHMAKPDAGVAFSVLFLVWTILRKLDNPHTKASDVLVGVALALAASFKQTSVFVAAPVVLGLIVLLKAECKLGWARIVSGLALTVGACVLLWVLLNIGIWIDLKSFLSWQRVTVAVNSRPATAFRDVQGGRPGTRR